MIKLARITFAVALLFGFAASAQAHNNNGCNPPPNCGGGGGGNNGGNCGPTLRCDAGGPYVVNLAPGSVTVQLDGLGSTGAQSYVWSTTYPGASFNDATLPNPILMIPVANQCSFTVEVCLLVKRPGASKSCCTTVKVRDHEKPVIECPELAKVFSGDDTSPQSLGFATATDNCDQHVSISYCDRIIYPDCKGDRFAYVIERTWKAVDDNCNVAKCIQNIDVVRILVNLDAAPGACPNLYNRNSCTLFPIAIVGSPTFNVAKIQWNSVRVWGYLCDGGPVAPECLNFGDTSTNFYNGLECLCTTAGADGKLDLVARFKRSTFNYSFGMWNKPAGTTIPVIVTGKTCDGIYFLGQDCITVQ